jgi:hypothetical protein
MNIQDKIKAVESWPKKAGKNDFLKYLHGERLTQRQAIKAMCYSCCCGEPGTCSVQFCPLLPFNAMIHNKDAAVSTSTGIDSNLID